MVSPEKSIIRTSRFEFRTSEPPLPSLNSLSCKFAGTQTAINFFAQSPMLHKLFHPFSRPPLPPFPPLIPQSTRPTHRGLFIRQKRHLPQTTVFQQKFFVFRPENELKRLTLTCLILFFAKITNDSTSELQQRCKPYIEERKRKTNRWQAVTEASQVPSVAPPHARRVEGGNLGVVWTRQAESEGFP